MSSEHPPQPYSHQPQPVIQQNPPQRPVTAQWNAPPQNSPHQSSTLFRFQPGGSPVPPSTPETIRKRARPTVSCLECRRKKLKCDRVQPCSQCVKGHREGLCQFTSGATKVGVSRPYPQAEDVGDERAAKRIQPDERTPQSISTWDGRLDDAERRDETAPAAPMLTMGRIHVKGNRSRYLGIGDRMAMLDHFEDARNYVMNCFEDPETRGLMQELTVYQKSFQRKPKKAQIPLPRDHASLVSEMLKSLPTEGSFGTAYTFYEMHWEGLTRVMHTPTFLKESEDAFVFLKSQEQAGDYMLPANIRESLIPQMIGILALSARTNKSILSSTSEGQVSVWMEMIQRWLDGLKGKERLNIQTLRTQILLLQLKMSSLAQTSDLWKESGTLVRSAMIMGLHQDPADYEEISLFEKEQRRKLWRTTVELDMQFSLAGGMPAAIRASDFHSRMLENVDDFFLKEDMITYPEYKPGRFWTDALPQVIMSKSIGERLETINILAGNISIDDAKKLWNLVRFFEHSLQSLPTPSRAEEAWGQRNERSPGRLFTKIMLDVQLRRPTLCIYQQLMLEKHYPEARKGAVRGAVAMLNHIDALDPEVADPNTIKNRDQLDLFHVLCKKDIIQAALILCLEIRSFSLASREGEGRVNGVQILQDDLLPWTKTSLTRIVENTLNSLFQRLGEFGSDLKDILPLSVVLQSARSDGTPEDKKMLMKKGTERILKACREALPHIAQTPAASHDGSVQSPNPNTQQAPETPAPQQAYNATEYQVLCPFPDGVKTGFTEYNSVTSIPDTDPIFQDFDFGFTNWDMGGSWF